MDASAVFYVHCITQRYPQIVGMTLIIIVFLSLLCNYYIVIYFAVYVFMNIFKCI